MSVINKMLQELERRQSGAVSQGHIGGAVRISAAAEPTRVWRRVAIGVGLVAIGGAVAYSTVWMKKQAPASGAAAVATAAPAAPAVPVAPAVAAPVAAAAATGASAPAPVAQAAPVVAAASAPTQATAAPSVAPTPSATPAPAAAPVLVKAAPQRKPLASAKAVPDRRAPVKEASSPTTAAVAAPARPMVKGTNVAARADDAASAKTISPRQDAEYRYQKALPLIQSGRLAEAQEMLQSALAADPSHGPARQLLAGVLIDSKHGKEAEALLRAGLEKNPQQVAQAMMLAHLQVEGGDLPSALATLRQSVSYADSNANYHALFAALLQRNGQHQDAVDQYSMALSKQPASAPWLVGLGISLQAQKRMAEARDAFMRAKQTGALGSDLSGFVDQRLKQTQAQAQREEGN